MNTSDNVARCLVLDLAAQAISVESASDADLHVLLFGPDEPLRHTSSSPA